MCLTIEQLHSTRSSCQLMHGRTVAGLHLSRPVNNLVCFEVRRPPTRLRSAWETTNMKFKQGARVRVKEGEGRFWYGVVVNRSGTGYDIRVGGTDRVIAVEKSLVHSPNPTATEILTRDSVAHALLVLGCPSHGYDCAETLIKYSVDTGARFGTVFMEGYYFDPAAGVKTEGLTKYQSKLLADLKNICGRVVGLETEETAPTKGTLPDREKFGRERRCTVANVEWAKTIAAGMSGNTSVVCCGTAHLVDMPELKLAPSLQATLKTSGGLQLRIPSYAVVDTPNGLYKPDGSLSGSILAFPGMSVDDDPSESGSESDSD